jgi:hypothetical protein
MTQEVLRKTGCVPGTHRLPGLSNLDVTFMAGKAYTMAYSENARAKAGMIVLLKTRGLPRLTGSQWRPTDDAQDYEYFWSEWLESHMEVLRQERSKASPKDGSPDYRRLVEIYQGKLRVPQTVKKPRRTEKKGFF